MKTCPKCNASMPDDVNFCTECGTKMSEPQEQTKFCISCGAKIPYEAQFCPECAAKQTEMNQAKQIVLDDISREKLLETLPNLSSSEARLLIEKYIIKTNFYQQFEADYIKFKNRTAKMIIKSNWEIYLASEIRDQITNFVDWFVYSNKLEHKIFLKKSILSLKMWCATIAVRIGRTHQEFIEMLSNL